MRPNKINSGKQIRVDYIRSRVQTGPERIVNYHVAAVGRSGIVSNSI